ncbi:MAG: hypothetical protein Q7S51_02060 [Gallionellaceae bacterium]|nr:hypothetical protein [Gallionellaceae bacterium]
MSKLLETLSMRKDLLQARSAIYRMQMYQDINAINEKLAGVRAAVISSHPMRSLLAGLVLQYLGHSRLARMLSWAGKVLMVIKVASVVVKLYRSSSAAKTEPEPVLYPPIPPHDIRTMPLNS